MEAKRYSGAPGMSNYYFERRFEDAGTESRNSVE
jgi:hypothetical protein